MALIAAACAAPVSDAPEEHRIAGAPTCPECTITREVVAVLSGPPEALVEWPQSAWADSRGRIILMQPNKRIPPAVFAPDGRFLQFLGREGDGPGEYRYAAHVAGDRFDTLHIADWGTHRLSLLGPDLKFARSFTIPSGGIRDLTVLEGGAIVVAGFVPEVKTGYRSMRIADRAGVSSAVLGPVATYQFQNLYAISAARDGGFWAVRRFADYRIAHFSLDGEATWYGREPDWLVKVAEGTEWPDLGWLSQVRAIWEDDAGLLWVAATVPVEGAKVAMDTIRSEGQAIPVPRDFDQAFDTMIEVLDPHSRRLVATARFDEQYALAAGPGRLLHVAETETGLRISVVRFGLARP